MSTFDTKKFVINNDGFSLIQVLVVAGVATIIFTALTSQIISSSRQVHFLEAKMETMNLKQELNLLLIGGNPANCNDSFKDLTGINLTGSTVGDQTDITSQLTGTNPLLALKNNYSTNSRYINVTNVYLFKPYNKIDGSLNNSPPIFEFKLKIAAQEKSGTGTGMIFNVDGPTLKLNITSGTTIDSPTACAISTSGTVTVRSNTAYNGGRWVSVTANCLPGEVALGGGGQCVGSIGVGVVHGTIPAATSFTISSCGDPATFDWSGWTGTAYVYCRAP